MADGVVLNAGAGGVTAVTDDCGAPGHAQVVKLAISTDGSATLIPAEATNGLDVDVTRVIPGTSATHLGKAEDVAAAGGDTGVAVLTVRDDTPTGATDANGDYQPLKSSATGRLFTSATIDAALPAGTNNIGDVDVLTVPAPLSTTGGGTEATALRVTIASNSTGLLPVSDNGGSLTVDNGGTFAVQAAIATGTSGPAKAEDTASANTDVGMAMVAVRKATPANTSDTDGDYEFVQISAGRIWASVVVDTALPAGNANIGDVDVVTVPADPFGVNADAASATGSISAKLRFIASTGIPITGTVTVNNTAQASTNTQEVVGDVAHDAPAAGNPLLLAAYASAAAPTDVSGDADAVRLWALRNGSLVVNMAYGGTLLTATTTQETVGDVADDAVAAGNPVLICGVAVETDGTDPTTVSAEGDAAQLRTDRGRRLLVNDMHPRGFTVSADYAAAQTNASVKAAPGAGLSLYITDLEISNGAVAGNITLLDGSGGTVVFEFYPAINGGVVSNRRTPIRLTANTALCITSTTVTTHSVNIGGYIAP